MIEALYNRWRMAGERAKGLTPANAFLSELRGLVHVGANRGSERHRYAMLGLDVLWVEADPKLYAQLSRHIAGYPRQRAINALVSDTEGEEVTFYVASNKGASSSMLPMAAHSDMFPEVTIDGRLTLRTRTMAALAAEHGIDLSLYDGLLLDVQGAELKVLKGFGDLLDGFRILKVEAADFPAYEGGAMIDEILAYCGARGFRETARFPFAQRPGLGSYYDVILRRG